MSVESCCPSCNRPWSEHPSIAATCAKLQIAECRAKSFQSDLDQVRDGFRRHGAEAARMQEDLMRTRREVDRLRERLVQVHAFVDWFSGPEWEGMCVTGAVRRRVSELVGEL